MPAPPAQNDLTELKNVALRIMAGNEHLNYGQTSFPLIGAANEVILGELETRVVKY